MILPQLSTAAVARQLRDISFQPGEPFRSAKISLLKISPDLNNKNITAILAYHDTLLALLAWPETNEIRQLAKKNLYDLTTALKETMLTDKLLELKLNGTGIPATAHTGRFSFAITNWLVNQFGNNVELHSSEASPETVKLFFRSLLPAAEYEAISTGELNLLQRIKKLKAKTGLSDIEWLTDLIEAASLPYPAKELLFNELKLFVTWKLDHPGFNRSFISLPVKKIYYHQELIRTPDIKKILNAKLPLPARLSVEQQQHLVYTAKATLVFIFRETDPFSYAAVDKVKLFELGRGFSIGLYSMQLDQRLSIESYIGYLVFKNGIPVAYGGGWIFGKRCQFGINILAPFRGGESAYIFSQLIRTYHQYFGATLFVIKPYQFGKNNREALQSGAFWFYYKQGFRPSKYSLQKLAEEEWEKKKNDKQYRSSVESLKKFTGSNLVLDLSKETGPDLDASSLSGAITSYINKNFNGNRDRALHDCLKRTKKQLNIQSLNRWNSYEKKALEEWSLLIRANLSLTGWSDQEKKQLIQLIKAKANKDELKFIKLLQKQQRFWKDLADKFF